MSAIDTPFLKQTSWQFPYITQHVCCQSLSKAASLNPKAERNRKKIEIDIRSDSNSSSTCTVLGGTSACSCLFWLSFFYPPTRQDCLIGSKCCPRSFLLRPRRLPKAQTRCLHRLLLRPSRRIRTFLLLMVRFDGESENVDNKLLEDNSYWSA